MVTERKEDSETKNGYLLVKGSSPNLKICIPSSVEIGLNIHKNDDHNTLLKSLPQENPTKQELSVSARDIKENKKRLWRMVSTALQ